MSSDPSMIVEVMYSIFIIGILVSSAIGVYSAYWSLTIRKSLVVRMYQRQALLVGAFTLYGLILTGLFYFVFFFEPSLKYSSVGFAQGIVYLFFIVILLAWIDSTIRIGRKSDPLRRDPLHWSSILRWIIWILMGVNLIATIVLSGGNISSSFGETRAIGIVLAFILIAISIIPLFLVAKRSGDRFYRRSIEWFGIAVALLTVEDIGFNTIFVGNGIVYTPINFAWAIVSNFALFPFIFYSTYRCARSLVPLNRIEL